MENQKIDVSPEELAKAGLVTKKKTGLLLAILFVLAALAAPVFAEEGSFLEEIEPGVEIMNLVLAIIIVAIGISVLPVLAGKLAEGWNYFLAAILLFGAHEVIGILKEFGIFKISGLYAVTELIFIVAFLLSTYKLSVLFREVAA